MGTVSMPPSADHFRTARRVLACLWALVGAVILTSALHSLGATGWWMSIQSLVGAAFVAGASGLAMNKVWARVCVGFLMIIVILWASDMALFIAWRGLGAGRLWLLGAVVVLTVATVCTWILLAATRPEIQEP